MAENNTLLEKLDGLVSRFEEVSTLITDPNVIADQKRYVKLTKEYKELNEIIKARKEYMQCLNGLEEARLMMAETGHVPFGWSRRAERKQGRVRRPPALCLEEPEYRRKRRNPDRMYRNARPAEEQGTRPHAPAFVYI